MATGRPRSPTVGPVSSPIAWRSSTPARPPSCARSATGTRENAPVKRIVAVKGLANLALREIAKSGNRHCAAGQWTCCTARCRGRSPRSAAVHAVGGDLGRSEVAGLALERGGHLYLGLEF